MVDGKQYSVSAIKSARGSEYNGDQAASVLLISEYRLRTQECNVPTLDTPG